MHEEYKVKLPTGKCGDWSVEHFEVNEKQAEIERLSSIFNGNRGVPAGTYTALKESRYLIMSDTPNEIQDHLSIIREAKDHVLINGLGLGVVLQAVIEKPEVTHVTVIEKSKEVIVLVGLFYQEKYGDKLTIIHADALDWKPPKGQAFGAVWHDIWNDICVDNLPEMIKLHRKYGRRTDWQDSWCRGECEAAKRRAYN